MLCRFGPVEYYFRGVALLLLQLKSMTEKSIPEFFKFSSVWKPSERGDDIEILINEERKYHQICYSHLRIPFLMATRLVYTIFNMYLFHSLGRRGVFDGVMEVLHQH
ncbi:unnamed protein product [Brassica rapa]|uniref:Uncharacterized protein n=1 Tax=Brassica campestris TaxID=3711 RepID=A0A8D9LRJ8_BRACM|nr:unnamed protein product [Brassica rapa]